MMAVRFHGEPILVEFRRSLRASRGKLVSGSHAGSAVHAASFLRERRIVLDSALLRNAAERDRILAHEIFHFVWWKLPPATRGQYANIIRAERLSSVPGEMGWSAEWRKNALAPSDWFAGTRRFRDYLCESFCDSAAALIVSLKQHPEITLPAGARRARFAWLRNWMEVSLTCSGLKI